MEQYIKKSDLVAEIERLKNTSLEYGYNTMQKVLADSGKDMSLVQLQNFIDTLEVKDIQEEPVSEDLEEAAVEAFKQIVDSDKNNFLEIFKAGAEWGKNHAMDEIQAQSMALAHGCPKENTSENLKEAADNALESITDQYDIISVGSCLEMFRLGAEWQKTQEYTCYEEAFEDGAKWKKEKTIDKACKWIDENAAKYLVDRFVDSTRVVGIDTSITEDFRKDMED